jgi:hypothetical protein
MIRLNPLLVLWSVSFLVNRTAAFPLALTRNDPYLAL